MKEQRMNAIGIVDLQAGLGHIGASPRDAGSLELIVRRPRVDEREVLTSAHITIGHGMDGDRWGSRERRTNHTEITLMNARCVDLLAGGDVDRWPLAGDQLYVDFDLGQEGLPAGSRIAIGSAVLVVSEQPHTGCAKFSARFGSDALRWINSPVGRELRMRGMNTRVVEGGTIRTGDSVRRV
jgi:hypothetical protein